MLVFLFHVSFVSMASHFVWFLCMYWIATLQETSSLSRSLLGWICLFHLSCVVILIQHLTSLLVRLGLILLILPGRVLLRSSICLTPVVLLTFGAFCIPLLPASLGWVLMALIHPASIMLAVRMCGFLPSHLVTLSHACLRIIVLLFFVCLLLMLFPLAQAYRNWTPLFSGKRTMSI